MTAAFPAGAQSIVASKMAKFGKRLKTLRQERDLKKKELADLLQVSERTYAYYGSNEREPTFSSVEKLADYFNVTTDYLLGRTKDPHDSFSDEFARIQKDAFHETFDELISKVTKAIKRSVKIGKKQASVREVIGIPGDPIEAEKALKLEIEKLLAIADVDVKIEDLNAPLNFMGVTVQVSWGTQNT